MSIQAKYFCIAVFLIGSIGIWLPIGIESLVENKVTFHNIPPNVTTYFVTILFAGCIDYFLVRLNEANATGLKSVFLNLIFIGLVSLALVVFAVICNVKKMDGIALVLALLGVVLSFRIWWLANVNNPNFINASAPLGGDPSRPLSN